MPKPLDYRSIIAANLRLLLAQKKVNQSQASRLIGITRRTLIRLLSGEEDVKLSTLEKIAVYTGRSVPFLLTPIKI